MGLFFKLSTIYIEFQLLWLKDTIKLFIILQFTNLKICYEAELVWRKNLRVGSFYYNSVYTNGLNLDEVRIESVGELVLSCLSLQKFWHLIPTAPLISFYITFIITIVGATIRLDRGLEVC